MPIHTTPTALLDLIECASRDEISALQLQRLKATLHRVYDNVPHYRNAFDAKGVHPEDLRELRDLAKFPFTTKKDLRDNYPFGLFAVPMQQVLRIHASSGTTGKPTVVGYTRGDIDHWADLVARSIRAAGGRAGDMLHVAYGYGLFTGGLGAHYGAERLGCTVIPMSGGQTEKQVQLIQDFKPQLIMVTPSYMQDHFYPEVIDPDTGQVLADGSEGELVFTSLTKEAFPVIRYRTRDLTRLLSPTSRSFRRMGKIVGRSDDMLIIRGVNVFPTQIEELVLQHGRLSAAYQLVVTRENQLDEVEVLTELQTDAGMSVAEVNEVSRWLQNRIKTMVGISTQVKILPPNSIERTLTGKARRVVDKRTSPKEMGSASTRAEPVRASQPDTQSHRCRP